MSLGNSSETPPPVFLYVLIRKILAFLQEL